MSQTVLGMSSQDVVATFLQTFSCVHSACEVLVQNCRNANLSVLGIGGDLQILKYHFKLMVNH